MTRPSRLALAAALPVVLVNAVAFSAQLGFWHAHLAIWPQAVLVALALESIAVYLAWLAHLAQLADDSALRLRLSAYGIALVIGALNYSHYCTPAWRPTVPAVTFGMMSVLSPWLWSAYSRRVSRDALKAIGDIEPHAVRLGVTRWAWHPVRSCQVMYAATWLGVTKPAEAIALLSRDDTPAVTSEPLTPVCTATNELGRQCCNDLPCPRHGAAVTPAAAPAVMAHSNGGTVTRKPTNAELADAAGVSLSTYYRQQRARNGTKESSHG